MEPSHIPIECTNSQDDPPAVEFNLECTIHCLDWSPDNSIAFGHDLGVGLLEQAESPVVMPTEIQRQWTLTKRYFHLGKRVNIVRAKAGCLATAHPDNSISVLKDGSIRQFGGTRGHSDKVTDVDISTTGIIASTGNDRYVLVWEESIPRSFRLSGMGQKVKFWNDGDSDRLIVLESDDKIRILDWRKGQWLLTIYPGKKVDDIGVIGGDLVAVGNGWWKKFNINSLTGGCGYTPPTDEGRLMTNGSSNGKMALNKYFAAYASNDEADIFDLRNASEHGPQMQFNDRQVNAMALNTDKETLAVASGSCLLLYTPRPEVVFS